MKIKDIIIKDFKCIDTCSVAPQKINAIIGPNGKGKSSLLEAIKASISGKAPASHIRAGTSKAMLSIDIDGLGEIERVWEVGKASKTKLNKRTATQAAVAKAISENFGFTPTTTEIMSSADAVENLFGENFAKYLLKFLKNDMDIDKLCALCELSPAAEAELRMMLPCAPEVITLEDVEEAHDAYRASRTDVSRSLATLQKKAEFNEAIPSRTSSELQELLRKTSEKIGAATTAVSAYEAAIAADKSQKAQITAIKKALGEVASAKNPSAAEIENLKLAIQQTKDLQKVVLESKAENQSHASYYRKVLDTLNDPVCPISKKLICTTDKTAVKAEIEMQIKRCEASIEEAEVKYADSTVVLNTLEARQATIVQRQEAYKRKIMLLSQLEKAEKLTITIPEVPDSKIITTLRSTYESLSREYKAAVRYEEAMDAKKKAEIAEKAVETYSELVTLLSPKGGARQKILEHNIAPLEAYCNDKAKKVLPRYAVKLDISNGFRMVFSDSAGNIIPYEGISSGERIRALYILVDMLNALNQFRILILDNLDGLDKESFCELLNVIEENEDDYDHIFLAFIDHADFVAEIKKRPAIAQF